ncbi:MAG: hypothetical protein M1824_006295 [Vezdaea acicularis]|nr:MAG: hypothetical protein M1824_006295 [Vezdaea acicularis]
MAISGPTGDYLQGGDSPVVLDAELADDLCAWFGSYGYSSEGRWVDRYDWRDALPAPVELPGSDVYTRSWRSSFSSTQSAGSSCSAGSVAPAAASSGAADKGDKRGKKRESAMSCNLNDLSDFLGFDVGCNGAWDDDCATPMELEARELMGELA